MSYVLGTRRQRAERTTVPAPLIVSLRVDSFFVCRCSYDFETRAVARLLKGHTKPVVALRYEQGTAELGHMCMCTRAPQQACGNFKFAPHPSLFALVSARLSAVGAPHRIIY